MDNKNSSLLDMEQPKATRKKRVMIAGVGNLFMKDDAFGVEVVKKMMQKEFPEGVEIKDFGTGGLKLAYDLMKGYDGLILLDASKRGGSPGTLYVIEPDEKEFQSSLEEGDTIDPHGGDPLTVLRFVKAFGSWPAKVMIVACEPASTDEFEMGLSDSVKASVDKAIEFVNEIINGIYSNTK
ncbi:MAG TPA: hydrogenase maturation protease [Puia sp.]|nr:hydrogenase maturation protease [Puia sp.]